MDSNNSPQEDLLKQAYQEVTKKITSAHETTGKALSEMKAKIAKEIASKYDSLKKFAEEAEKIASARQAVDWALDQLKTETSYKDILKTKGITLRSADFYLGLVRKESGFNQQAVSNGNAKGLFQILVQVDKEEKESSIAVDDVNKFYGLEAKVGDIYCADVDKDSRKIAAQNNALVGILFWHKCRDSYGNKIKSDLSADDKDKLGNMIYNMGSGDVKRLWQALGDPKDFKEFGTALAEKLNEAYPDDLENKTESVKDPELNTFYESYIKKGKDFSLYEEGEAKTVDINDTTFKLPKVLEAIKYAELVFSLNHVKPQAKAVAKPIEAPAAVAQAAPAPKNFYIIGEGFESIWGIAKDLYGKSMIEKKVPDFSTKYPTNGKKIDAFIALITAYNKPINKNFDKKGEKILIPPEDFMLKHFGVEQKPTAAPVRTQPKAPEKSERLGPTHILKGQTLMILDSITPSYFIIDTKGIEGKMKFKQAVSISNNGEGRNFESDCIQVKVDGLEGYFQMENGKNMSLWPLNKGGLWEHYNIHLDDKSNVIMIAPKIKTAAEAKPVPSVAPKVPEVQKQKDYLDPDQPLDLSWPDGVEKRIPKQGEAIYIGKDGKQLGIDGEKLYQETPVPEPEYATPDWLDPNKGSSKNDRKWDEMEKINGIVFHATEGIQHRDAELFKKQNTHFLVKRNGDIWQVRDPKYETNHTGNFNDNKYNTRAIWDGNETPYDDKIGIEVETYDLGSLIKNGEISCPVHADKNSDLNIGEGIDRNGDAYTYTTNSPLQRDIDAAWVQAAKGRAYNEDQYPALERLARFLAFTYKIKQKDMLPHSMVGSQLKDGEHERNRKFDPCNLDYKKIHSIDNYRIIDPDVARGTIKSNELRTDGERKGDYLDRVIVGKEIRYKVFKKGDEYHYKPSGGFGGQNFMYSGLKGAQDICEELGDCKKPIDASVRKINAKAYGKKDADLDKQLSNGEIKVDSNMTHFEAVKHNVSKECPAEIIMDLSLVDVLYYSFDNQVHKGQVVIHKKLAGDIQQIFALAYEMKFPIGKVIPISHPNYNWSDNKSIADNNTSSFNYRTIAEKNTLSDHALGTAIDINPDTNPYIDKNGKVFSVSGKYDSNAPGALTADHPIVKKFIALGWNWGGNYKNIKDYQHFSKDVD